LANAAGRNCVSSGGVTWGSTSRILPIIKAP
jgi:hypothetical protein